MRQARSLAVRSLIVALYVAVYCVALPAALWFAGLAVDGRVGWERDPWAGGGLLLAFGIGLIGWGMVTLLTRGGGLPVSALPPPRFTRRGPYRHVRHPIYLGFNIAVAGAGLLLGSRGLAFVVSPLFVPVWVAYARVEEHFLLRRFGYVYRRYQRQVGFLPRLGLYRFSQFLQLFNVLNVEVSGREHVLRRGAVVLVFNHSCYIDPGYVGTVTSRPVHHMTTAEAYRSGFKAFLVKHFCNVPVRRYRQDVAACREMVRLLAEGEVIGIAVEGERAWLGEYQGALPDVAGIVARLGVPVIPIGISGGYDAGPRWSDIVRRRPVTVRVGPPIPFAGREATAAIDEAIISLLVENPQHVDLPGLPRDKLERVLWSCPSCGSESHWVPAQLSCGACDLSYKPTEDGWLRDPAGNQLSLAELGREVCAVVDQELEVEAGVWEERSIHGPIEPLRLIGEGLVRLGPEGLSFGALRIAIEAITRVGTERADTLQVATRRGMWQVHLHRGSAYRLQLAVERWRAAHRADAEQVARPLGLRS